MDENHTAGHARIGNHTSWRPHPDDLDPWLEVDFGERTLITGLLVQGGGREHSWVKSFTIRFGNDLTVFWAYEEYKRLDRQAIVVKANGEPGCIKPIYLTPPIKARYLEINPTESYGGVALRLEVLGCRDNDCDFAAGIARGDIHNTEITASSSVDDERGKHGPANARLNPFGVPKSGWMPSLFDANPWLQVYLPGVHRITGVVTQGCGNVDRWTARYTIRYSADRSIEDLLDYPEPGRSQVFVGNNDRCTLKRNNLDPSIQAEVLRLYPQAAPDSDVGACLRLELIGCRYRACGRRLGMESGLIAASQITESSEYAGQEGDMGRLHHFNCWKPNGMGNNHWIQVDLLDLYTITGLITQGGYNAFLGEQDVFYWPDSYRVLYTSSRNDSLWRKYYNLEGDVMDFPAYPDPHTEKRHDFDRPFITRKLRIIPYSWRGYCLRMEILGCRLSEGQVCGEDALLHDGFCVGSVNTQSSGACDNIYAEGSQPITISSAATQQWLGFKRDDIKVNDRHYQYKVGLRTQPGGDAFAWADGTPMTYDNFRWPTNITDNSTEWCVYVDMNDDLRWREFQCRNDAVPRATICQLDVDECTASDNRCSHTCSNFPGGFQCICPRGFRLDSMDGIACTTLCTDKPPVEGNGNSSTDCLSDPYGFGCLDLNIPDIDWPNFSYHWPVPDSADESGYAPSTLPPMLLGESTCNDVADVRCEEMWARNVNLEYVYFSQGYIHSLSFPPWYNQGSTCQINIQIPPGNFVRLEIHEMVLRRMPRMSRCIDVLNVTDHLTPHHSMSRGSFCGELRDLVVTCRSNNVTLRLDIGAIGQDMPKKLGFMASYSMTDCTASTDECDPGCGKKDVLTAPRGNFSTTDFPSKLPPFSICAWNISLPTGSFIALNFSEFLIAEEEDSSECVDFVQIFLSDDNGLYDNGPAGQPMCGSTPSLIMSNSSSVQVVFRTGLDSKSLGFLAQYASTDIPGCGVGFYSGEGIQRCDMPEAAIASVDYPRPYRPGTSSIWHLTTNIGTYIELQFVTFDVPGSYGDSSFVKINDGAPDSTSGMLLARLSNERPPRGPVRSSFNEMTVRFRADGSVTGNGFYAKYRAAVFTPKVKLFDNETTDEDCQSGWRHYNGQCYAFREANNSIRWTDAQRLCSDENANLVSISDFAEMNFIHSLMTSSWLTNNSNTYIGLRYHHLQLQHRWQDESPLSYADWFVPGPLEGGQISSSSFVVNGAPQPDGGALERCSQIILRNLHSTSHWHDVPCASKNSNQFICEKSNYQGHLPPTSPKSVGKLSSAVCENEWTLIHGQYCVKMLLNSSATFLTRCPANSRLATSLDPQIAQRLPFYIEHVWGMDPSTHTRFLIGPRGEGDDRAYDVMTYIDGHWRTVHERAAGEIHGAICAMEASVETPGCPSDMFTCGSGECIHRVFVCDNRRDCTDNGDEASCSNDVGIAGYTCTDTSFRCGSGECVSLSFYCDFHPHCQDASDEANCSIVTCTDLEFRCNSGQCINKELRCNLVTDCVDESDEQNCEAVSGGFQCYDGAWLPAHTHCDGTKDCPGNNREDEPNSACVFFQCKENPNLIQCNNGACADRRHICLYDFDQYGYQTGCRDVTHLRFCGEFECSNNTFKCPGSYCIPLHRRCDVTKDCPGGEDEIGCANHTCNGHYRCHDSRVCVTKSYVCDGIKQCPAGDDELFCETQCPDGCSCTGLSYACTGISWSDETAKLIPRNVRKLELRGVAAVSRRRRETVLNNNVTVEYTLYLPLDRLQQLAELDLSGNGIDVLKPGMFKKQNNLYKLVLADNNIRKLENGTFEGLHRLQFLNLTGNPLAEIASGAFLDVVTLPILDLGYLQLRHLQPGVFKGLDSVEALNVGHNPLVAVDRGAFDGLEKTSTLDIRQTEISKVDPLMFQGLDSIQTVYADKYLYCCLLSDIHNCEAPMDELSSCEDLMRNPILRVFIWILGFSALVGNAFVIAWRARSRDREQSRKIQTFLILNLAVADLLMGVYMIVIASADLHYRSDYMIHADEWQESVVCQMAGFISVLSSESSVFLLVLITTDRFLGVVFPFSRWRLHTKSARYAVAGLWLLAFFLSLLPVVLRPAFGDRFYGRSSVCLALPFTRTKLPGWEYSVVLFLGVNLLGFLVIFLCYFSMYIAIKRASKQCTRKRENMEEIKMATKMGIIVGTDFFCWMPIIIMGLLSLSGTATIPQEMYAWAAVFMLPVNSAANPYLYTISSLDRKRKKARTSTSSPTWKTECTRDSVDFEMVKYAKGDSNSRDKDNPSLMATVYSEQVENRVLPYMGKRMHSFMLRQHIAETKTPLAVSAVAAIENDLRRALEFLHKNGLAHGKINEDFVAIDKDKKDGRIAFLVMRGEPLDGDENSGVGNSVSAEEEVPLLRRDNRQLDELLARLRGSH
ncbi:uncharacterized protein LOC110988203 [Acanthaster planci]|uniref:Uncharacterized protein LOC110988203 n=1 Tax=Acanthaster planci TaxID=133434 RepID=A0A8B7ZQQ5_ACAPL|nr:uncharacterized protein LOC110988203 [Acanthaster planci]